MQSSEDLSPPSSEGFKMRPALNALSRRSFLASFALGSAGLGITQRIPGQEKVIQGFERSAPDPGASKNWEPISDRKIRVGIAGYGVCKFGADFGFQDHPNVEVVAVTDLLPD